MQIHGIVPGGREGQVLGEIGDIALDRHRRGREVDTIDLL